MDRCWRCGRMEHAEWCRMPGGCDHCGWSPHRWWCLGEDTVEGETRGKRYGRGDSWRSAGGPTRVLEPA